MVAWRENISDANVQVAAFGWQDWTATACAARKGSGPAATFLDFFAWKAYFDFARDGLLEGVAWASLVTCACRNSDSHVQMMKSAEKWRRQNATNGMYCSRR